MDIFGLPEEVKDIIISILSNGIWVLMGGIIIWSRSNVYAYLITKRIIIAFFTKKKYIIIWNDDQRVISKHIGQLLIQKGLDNYRFKYLKEPDQILYYSSSPKTTHAIIFIVSDVTKLAESFVTREKIQHKLLEFTQNGGLLIGTHDLIYRRCRNQELQVAFGCEITQFKRQDNPYPVAVDPRFINHPIVKDVASTFLLDDGEVTTGEWSNDVQQIITTTEAHFENRKKVPALCIRQHYHEGLLVWISSGDKGNELANSVRIPQPEFVQILYNAIYYTKDIKAFV